MPTRSPVATSGSSDGPRWTRVYLPSVMREKSCDISSESRNTSLSWKSLMQASRVSIASLRASLSSARSRTCARLSCAVSDEPRQIEVQAGGEGRDLDAELLARARARVSRRASSEAMSPLSRAISTPRRPGSSRLASHVLSRQQLLGGGLEAALIADGFGEPGGQRRPRPRSRASPPGGASGPRAAP